MGSTVASGFSKQRSGWEWDGARGEPGGAGRCRGRKPKGTPDREGGCAVAWGRRSPKDRTEQRGGGGGREARGVGPTSGRMGVVSVPAGCSHGPAFLFCPPALPCPLLPCPQGFRHTSLGKTALGKKQNGSENRAAKKSLSCWSIKSCDDEVAAPSPAGPAPVLWALDPFGSPVCTAARSPAAPCLGPETQRQGPQTRSPGARESKGGLSRGEGPAGQACGPQGQDFSFYSQSLQVQSSTQGPPGT